MPQVTLNRGQAQLFVDDHLIATQDGLKRTLRQPEKDRGGHGIFVDFLQYKRDLKRAIARLSA